MWNGPVVVLIAALAGCSGDTDDDKTTPTVGTADTGQWYFTPYPQTRIDEGTACLRAGDPGVQADVPGTVSVDVDCVGCGVTVLSSTCTATLVDSELQVTSTVELEIGPTPPTITCTCVSIGAECDAPALPAGPFSLVYGGAPGVAFTVPSDGAVCASAP